MGEIQYPANCRPLTDDLSVDELIRRLKTLAQSLQQLNQDESNYKEYIPLAMQLTEDSYLTHQSRDVQLLIACCIADILRIFAPDAPYRNPDKIRKIFKFIVQQLHGLKDPKDPAFKRYFYLLENLSYVKSFNMCFDIEDSPEIFCNLFELFFRILNDEHSLRVRNFMLDVMTPLIIEGDSISNKLLDIILMNIIEPNKTHKKNAYTLAHDLIKHSMDTLEPYISNLIIQVLILGKEDNEIQISKKMYDVIYELYQIGPRILRRVLPQMECKIKSRDDVERHNAVSLLARMFSAKDSELAIKYPSLWTLFIGRFNDICVNIRIKCVQYTMHFLLNHSNQRKDIIEILKNRQHDTDENVRYEIVMSIVATAKKQLQIVVESDDLMTIIKERSLDLKYKIRKEALTGLAMIYKSYLLETELPRNVRKSFNWIKTHICQGYFMGGVEDRILIERLMNAYLVPYKLKPEDRMKKLLHLFTTMDVPGRKAFLELYKTQASLRVWVSEWVALHSSSENKENQLNLKTVNLSKQLPDPLKSQEYLEKFSAHMRSNNTILECMELIVDPNIQCHLCIETISYILRRLGQPVMTNLYYNTVKMLLERISSVTIDHQSLKLLISYIKSCSMDEPIIEDADLDQESAVQLGFNLLEGFALFYPAHFQHEDVVDILLSILELNQPKVTAMTFKILMFMGKCRPLVHLIPNILDDHLMPLCTRLIQEGSTMEAKGAIRCLVYNSDVKRIEIFSKLLRDFVQPNLTPTSNKYRLAIVAFGHIAFLLPQSGDVPDDLKNLMKVIICRNIVKEILVKEPEENTVNRIAGEWCEESELPELTKCKKEALKAIARWLIGLRTDKNYAKKTFRMLNAFIVYKGDLTQSNKLCQAEMAWLRLVAGTTMLKICAKNIVGDNYCLEDFYNLSHLMMDDVKEIRSIFVKKLHKYAQYGPLCDLLPLDFLGLYAFGGYEKDSQLKSHIRNLLVSDIKKRRAIFHSLPPMPQNQNSINIPNVMPDYILVFSIMILAHDRTFVRHDDIEKLKEIEKALWFIIEPLISRNESLNLTFYKSLLDRMKLYKDTLHGDDDNFNYKLWAVCELALKVINKRCSKMRHANEVLEIHMPSLYLKSTDMVVNNKSYLPEELQSDINDSMIVNSISTLSHDSQSIKRTRKMMTRKAATMELMINPKSKKVEKTIDTRLSDSSKKIVLRDSDGDEDDDEEGETVGDDDPEGVEQTVDDVEGIEETVGSVSGLTDDSSDEEYSVKISKKAVKVSDGPVNDKVENRKKKQKIEIRKDMKNFHEMNLSRPLLKAISEMNYLHPTEIQQATIPVALLGKDIYGCAATGTGKTAAYMLPVLERLIYRPTRGPAVTRVLVLVPTRELGVQVYQVTKQLAQFTNIEIGLSVGGLNVKVQETVLRKNPDIVISTPGRLIDHLHNSPTFTLDSIDVLIIDEADRILDENFADQLNEIIKQCSYTRQTMLFSATISNKAKDLAAVSLRNPVKIFVNSNQEVALNLHQEFIRIRDDKKRDAFLASLLCTIYRDHCMVFVDMKKDAHRLALILRALGLRVDELHGNLNQVQRLEALKRFKDEQTEFLIATDVAARGIDIPGVKTVINYKMPKLVQQYIHRVGRTARAGRVGVSVSLFGSKSEITWMKSIVDQAQNPVKNRTVDPKVIEMYDNKINEIKDQVEETLKNELAEQLLNAEEKKVDRARHFLKNPSKNNKHEERAPPKRKRSQKSPR